MAKPQAQDKSAPAATEKSASTAVAHVGGEQLPAYLRDKNPGIARGSENVGQDDIVIPRLELAQSISPCIDESDGAYIPGIKAGDLFNNVTRQNYGSTVEVIPVYFKKEHIIWKDRKKGGGFVATFDTAEAAEAARAALPDADDHKVNDTANHFCLLRNPATGKLEQIVVSLAVSKLKMSRTWNSLIRLAEGDSFARVYAINSFTDTNKSDEKFKNLQVKLHGFPEEREYLNAEQLYLAVAAGQVKVNRDLEPGADETGERQQGGKGPGEY